MSNYTPGPWVIDNRPLYPDGNVLHSKPTHLGLCVANVQTAFGFISIHAPETIGKPCPEAETFDAQALANAQLIIAAKDLYEALKDIVRRTEEWHAAVEKIIGRQADSNIHLKAALAAIAKAEGAE